MSSENHYQLLGIETSASEEEIKRAFRQQIARYHPDKVQHLGKEFQVLAATRAAELTTAYTALSDAGRRAEYDREQQASAAAPPRPVGRPAAAAARPATEERRAGKAPPSSSSTATAPPPHGTGAPAASPVGKLFAQERAIRDEFVRRAAIGQLRQGLAAVAEGVYSEAALPGFDLAATSKPRLFRKATNPAVLGRFVPQVDSRAVADAWDQAGKWPAGVSSGVCVFLMGPTVVPAQELGDAIGEQRRKGRAAHVTVIALGTGDWAAHVPTTAPPVARDLVAWLRRVGRR